MPPFPPDTNTPFEDLKVKIMQQKPHEVFGSAGLSSGAFLKSDVARYRPLKQMKEPFIDGMHQYEESSESGKGKTRIDDPNVPDIQLTLFPRVSEPHMIKYANSSINVADQGIDERKSMLFTIALLNSDVRHEVRLNKNNPIYGNPYLYKSEALTEDDINAFLWAIKQVRVIQHTVPFNQAIINELYPGETLIDDDALRNWIKYAYFGNSHWCGTIPMGNRHSGTAIVDENLSLIGVKNLHVADASVIPIIPNGNVHSTVCMIAARAADIILSGYGN